MQIQKIVRFFWVILSITANLCKNATIFYQYAQKFYIFFLFQHYNSIKNSNLSLAFIFLNLSDINILD